MTDTTFTPRVFSGIKPSGGLQLGNYLGAIKRFVGMQGQMETVYCVVDMHAITVWQDPAELAKATREVAAGYLAAGLDPKKSILFNQSQVSAHAELGWIFNCVARVGWMNRMTQFKDKAGSNAEKHSLGLSGLSGADGRADYRPPQPCQHGLGTAEHGTGAGQRATRSRSTRLDRGVITSDRRPRDPRDEPARRD